MTIFFCSDHHFGHSNILTFKNEDGSNVRTFESVEEMNNHIVERHNAVVRPNDKVYFLGDVAFSHRNLFYLGSMHGEKVLIKGNHDTCKLSQYEPYFKDVRAVHQMKGLVMAHIPIHPDSLGRWGYQVHGHLHSNHVLDAKGKRDKRYFNVSMEVINFTPVSLEELMAHKPEV